MNERPAADKLLEAVQEYRRDEVAREDMAPAIHRATLRFAACVTPPSGVGLHQSGDVGGQLVVHRPQAIRSRSCRSDTVKGRKGVCCRRPIRPCPPGLQAAPASQIRRMTH